MFKGDIYKRMKFARINSLTPRAIEDVNKSFISFSQIAPLSTRLVSGCSIVRGTSTRSSSSVSLWKREMAE